MQRLLPYLLLLVGISMAAAFGARNGDTHNRYRAATWYADVLQSEEEDLAKQGIEYAQTSLDEARGDAKSEQDAIGLPAPTKRLTEWWTAGGFGWLVGVLLIIAGAGLARRQATADSVGDSSEGGSANVDFLERCGPLRDGLRSSRHPSPSLEWTWTRPRLARKSIRLWPSSCYLLLMLVDGMSRDMDSPFLPSILVYLRLGSVI